MTPTRREVPRDRLDAAIELASGATAVGMFAYGVALSYSVLHAIALAAGLPAWAAKVWPLGFEAFMASAALNALAEQRHRRHLPEWQQRVPWYPWTLTGLTAGASLLLNWFHPAIPLDPPPGWLVSLVYGLPPLAAFFAWHLFLQRVAHRRHAAAQPATSPRAAPAAAGLAARPAAQPDPLPAPARAGRPPGRPGGAAQAGDERLLTRAAELNAAHLAAHGRPVSRDRLRAELGIGATRAERLLAQLATPPAQTGGDSPPGPAHAGPLPGGPGAGNGQPARPAHLTPLPARPGGPTADGRHA